MKSLGDAIRDAVESVEAHSRAHSEDTIGRIAYQVGGLGMLLEQIATAVDHGDIKLWRREQFYLTMTPKVETQG